MNGMIGPAVKKFSPTYYWSSRYGKQGRLTVGCARHGKMEFERHTRELKKALSPLFDEVFAGKRVLDFGCGYGRMSKAISLVAESVCGVDIVSWPIEEAKKYARKCQFAAYDGKVIPHPDGFFSGALSLTVLQHIPPGNVEASCKEISRVMADGGVLLLGENTSQAEDKAHMWFRTKEEYLSFFPSFVMEREEVLLVDDTGERLTVLVLRKVVS